MGGSGSKYKMNSSKTRETQFCPDWLADSGTKISPLKKENFENGAGIGKGKFGIVFTAKHSPGNKTYAIKFISKQIIFECQCLSRIQQEFDIMEMVDHPFIVHCFGAFENSSSFGLVLEFAFGGELYNRMKTVHKMSENVAMFYFCEIALALHYLHDELNIVYRDIKPENILIDYMGHIKLCDFGFAVPMKASPSDTISAKLQDGCGTAMYVAPEIAGGFNRSSHGYPVDWWGLGCVLMEMVTGDCPFGDSETMTKFEIFNNINNKVVRYPLSMSMALKSLLKGLLDKNPDQRMSWLQVKSCAWCKLVVWDDLLKRSIQPPWVPAISSKPSTENFLKWDLEVPSGHSPPKVASYCSNMKLPRCRTSNRSSSSLVK
mmetsp:Transcript_20639/g.29553  ORF Transcript_20639/g.29553 Transcript_20639/m.29553 type:complete len:375 (-) Transcript_20639:452-1576(-)